MLDNWDGDRVAMRKSQECRQWGVNKNLPTILGEDNEATESAISAQTTQGWKIRSWFRKGNLQPRMVKKWNKTKVYGIKTDAFAISILRWGGGAEIPPDAEIQASTVNKAHRTQNREMTQFRYRYQFWNI